MSAGPFAGVNLDNIGSTEPSAPESAPSQVSEVSGQPELEAKTTEPQTPAALADLDKLERVRLGGKELSVKELRDSFLRHSDYTKKTKEVAEARKFAENFHHDFLRVVREPSLIEQFKQIYPKAYHAQVEQYLSEQSGAVDQDQTEEAGQQIPADVQQVVDKLLAAKLKPYEPKFQRLEQWETTVKEQETRAIEEQITTIHDRLEKKYPFADPDLVDFRVQLAKEKGVDITTANLSKVYESVYKDLHEGQKSRLDQQRKTQVDEQVKAGRESRDVGAGVGIPAAPPKKYNSISEVTKDALARFGK